VAWGTGGLRAGNPGGATDGFWLAGWLAATAGVSWANAGWSRAV
jgi:hypothetical protein